MYRLEKLKGLPKG